MKRQTDISEWIGLVIKILGTSVLSMWVFFDFSPASLGVLCFVPFELWRAKKERKQERIWKLNLAFKDALLYLKNAIAAGYSPEGGMAETVKGLEQLYHQDHRICREFRQMLAELSVGSTIEEVWFRFGERSKSEDIRGFAEIFSVVKRTGGDLGRVLKQSGDIIQGKLELQRELQTMIAAKKTEFYLMYVLLYAVLIYLKVFAPAMSEALYQTAFGTGVMWMVFFASVGLKVLGERMIRKELIG